MNQSLANIQQI